MFTKVDFSKTYRIEPVPSKTHPELKEKGLSSYPGTTTVVMAAYSDVLKRYKNTGLDENDPDVLRLTGKEKDDAVKYIKDTRTWLEEQIGQIGYLAPTSDGWVSDLATVLIETTQDLRVKVNGHRNILKPSESYRDAIALLIMMNDPNFPKSKTDLSSAQFRQAKYYLTTDEEVNQISKEIRNKTLRANAEFQKLFEDGKQKNRAKEIAYYLKIVTRKQISADKLFDVMYDSIFMDKTKQMVDRFLEAIDMDNATLVLYNMFNDGIKLGTIRVNKDELYYRGTVNYRKGIKESVEYLKTPSMAAELASLKEEISRNIEKYENVL